MEDQHGGQPLIGLSRREESCTPRDFDKWEEPSSDFDRWVLKVFSELRVDQGFIITIQTYFMRT